MQARVRLSLGLAGILAVFLSVPASAFVRSPVALLPDGDTRPEIHSAELRSPQPHNQLLEADLVVDAIDNDGIARFEYRWNSATYGAVHSVVGSPLQVSYASIRPNTRYALELRAIDIHNNPSAWYPVWSGLTPGPPHVIVAGDSIASGYTRRWFLGDATCRDSDLSYGRTVVSELSATLPDQWAVRYTNIAWASAGVDDMSSGGDDSCGGTHSSQLDQIERACDLALHSNWNLEARRASITRDISSIAGSLGRSTNARVFWTGYYDITGAELAPRWSPIGSECEGELDRAMGELHTAIRAGLGDDITWVDIDKDIATQSWAGWPHPNAEGHETIGSMIATAITDR